MEKNTFDAVDLHGRRAQGPSVKFEQLMTVQEFQDSATVQQGASGTTARTTGWNCAPAIESTISGEFTGWQGETIFKLDNGQIRQQAEYAYVYSYSYRPDVTIYQTTGGCRIKVEDANQVDWSACWPVTHFPSLAMQTHPNYAGCAQDRISKDIAESASSAMSPVLHGWRRESRSRWRQTGRCPVPQRHRNPPRADERHGEAKGFRQKELHASVRTTSSPARAAAYSKHARRSCRVSCGMPPEARQRPRRGHFLQDQIHG